MVSSAGDQVRRDRILYTTTGGEHPKGLNRRATDVTLRLYAIAGSAGSFELFMMKAFCNAVRTRTLDTVGRSNPILNRNEQQEFAAGRALDARVGVHHRESKAVDDQHDHCCRRTVGAAQLEGGMMNRRCNTFHEYSSVYRMVASRQRY